MSIHTFVYTYIPCRTCPAGLGFRYVYAAPHPLEALVFLGGEKKGCCMHTPHTLEFARRASNTFVQEGEKGLLHAHTPHAAVRGCSPRGALQVLLY